MKPLSPNCPKKFDDCDGSKFRGADKDNDRAVRCTDRGSTPAQGDRRFDRAVPLTFLLSFSSWSSRRAEQDAYWVSHTHEVMTMIRGTSRDVLENGNQRGAFALSGQGPSLVLCQTARDTIYQDTSRMLVFAQEER